MSLIRRAAAPLLERRAVSGKVPWGDSTPPTNGQLGGAAAGTNVTEQTALQVAAVYGSIGVLADGVSTSPLRLLSSTRAEDRRVLAPSPLITEPYSEISLIDWLVQYTVSLALRGNFYGHIIARDRNLYPTQIKPVHPDRVQVRRLSSGELEYRFYGRPVPLDDVFHVRYLSVADSLTGLNPIEYLRNTLGLARAADLYGGSFFQNSANPSGVIKVDGDLDEEETLALALAWKQSHQGLGAANMPAVLTGGADFKPISISPEDAQFLGSRQFSQGEISGMIFRVPPHMIGIVDRTTSWGSGIEQQETGFVRNTLAGYLTRLENALTPLHPPGQFVKFDLGQRLRGDKLQRFQAYSLGMLGGWLCPDDVRAEEDMPPVPGGKGKEFYVPINTELLQAALDQIKQSEQSPPAGGGIEPGRGGNAR